MKKYRVTEKHPWFKEGICEYNEQTQALYIGLDINELDLCLNIFDGAINLWLINGWIEEIKEPEFTKEDMIKFAQDCGSTHMTSPFYEINDNAAIFKYEDFFNKWINKRNENKNKQEKP